MSKSFSAQQIGLGAPNTIKATSDKHLQLGSSRVFGLDVIRAGAISLVLLCHYCEALFLTADSFYKDFLTKVYEYSGIIGVEIFFVLSGFLMGRIFLQVFETKHLWKDIKIYYIRRWMRTFPLYYIALMTFFAFEISLTANERSFPDLIPYALFTHSLFSSPLPDTFFSIAWSLAIEEVFYFIFPILMFVFYKIGRLSVKSCVIASATFLVLLCTALKALHYSPEEQFVIYRTITVYRLDAIAIGTLLFIYRDLVHSIFHRVGFSLPLILSILIYTLSTNTVYGDYFTKVFYLPSISIVVALLFPAIENFKFRNTLVCKTLTRISDLSYSLYLFHLPALTLSEVFFGTLGCFVYIPIALVITIYICNLLNKNIEVPFMKSRPKHTNSQSSQSESMPASKNRINLQPEPASRITISPTLFQNLVTVINFSRRVLNIVVSRQIMAIIKSALNTSKYFIRLFSRARPANDFLQDGS